VNLLLPRPEFSIAYLFRLNARLKEILTQMALMAKNVDYMLEIAAGRTQFSSVNKFGRSTNVDSSTDTDIHDGANADDEVDIWLAPTTARVHAIVSTDAADDSAGAGAKTIKIYGLTAWDADETSEVLTMDGTNNAINEDAGTGTKNSYVIIHRMKVVTKGASGPNVGVITATAATDGTVTAQINIGEGQTQMAIYGIPSTKVAYMTEYYASVNKKTSAQVDITLLVNPEPDVETLTFLTKHTQSLSTTGTNYLAHKYEPYNRIAGPAIIKMQASGSTNDLDVSAGFDLIMEDA